MRSRTRSTLVKLLSVAVMVAVAPVIAAQTGILADPARPDDDRARDAGSQPLEVFGWLGVERGMTVVDVVPGGGYNSHVLALMVGAEGHVHAAGTSAEGKTGLEGRFHGAGLHNVTVHERLGGLPDASADVVVIVRNAHDMFIPAVAEQYGMQPDPIFTELMRAMKPGAVLGIVDSRMPGEGVDANTHRISEALVIAELEARGFELLDRSELLADPDDDPSDPRWNDRAFMDRMLLKFRKAS